MYPEFWTNTIWYILLACISVFAFIFTLYKDRKNRKFDFAFFFAVLSVIYQIEVGIFTLFESYHYMPKIAKDPYADSIFGNNFSQISVSSTLLLIAALNLRPRWYFIFASIYFLIEELFVKLGIYQQTWYRTWLTPIGFILVCWIVKKWYFKMLSLPKKSFLYYITLILSGFSFFGHIEMIFFHTQLRVFDINIFPEFFRNQSVGMDVYLFTFFAIMVALYYTKVNWIWKGIVFIFLFLLEYALHKIGMMHFKGVWLYIIPAVTLPGAYAVVALLDYLLGKSVDSG